MSLGFFVFLVIFVIGVVSYLNNKPAQVLVCLFAIGSGCFKIFPVEESIVHPYDLMILLTLIITVIEYSKTKGYFRCKEDTIGKIILIVLVYTALVMVGSVILGQELLPFALKAYRSNLIFLLYFYYRRQTWGTVKRFIDIMLIFSVIQGVLFYLQLAGIEVLRGGGIKDMSGNIRYLGFPSLSVFFVLLGMLDDKMTIGKRAFLFAFFGGALLLSMNRGPILSIVFAYGTYILVHRRIKNFVYLLLFAGVYFIAVAPVLDKRNNEKSSGSEELRIILENPLATHESFTTGSGSALYRIACVSERVEFLLNNPHYIPFGIGTVHENSPMNHYNVFITGLHNDVLQHQKETVSSDDITWVNILMNYGFIGVFLFVMIYITGAKVALPLLKKSNDALFSVAGSLPLAYLFASMGTNHFNFAIRLLEFLLPFIIIRMYQNKQQILKIR